MAIPKKSSRPIHVDGIQYRWRIRHQPTYVQALTQFTLSFAVELAEDPGAKLVVIMPQVRPDNWFNDPTPEAVLPSHVEKLIRQALKLGWQPDFPGSPFEMNLSNNYEISETPS
jgi:hypothetical protein